MKKLGLTSLIIVLVSLISGCSGSKTIIETEQTLCSDRVLDAFLKFNIEGGYRLTDSVIKGWKMERGCYSLNCEDFEWVISQEGDGGCNIDLQVQVNGKEEVIRMFYIDTNNYELFAGDDVNNFGMPGIFLEGLKEKQILSK